MLADVLGVAYIVFGAVLLYSFPDGSYGSTTYSALPGTV